MERTDNFKKELLEEYKTIIIKLNEFYSNNTTFSKTELMNMISNDRQKTLVAKGIIITLIYFNYIEIVSKIGYYNYLYKVKKEIK